MKCVNIQQIARVWNSVRKWLGKIFFACLLCAFLSVNEKKSTNFWNWMVYCESTKYIVKALFLKKCQNFVISLLLTFKHRVCIFNIKIFKILQCISHILKSALICKFYIIWKLIKKFHCFKCLEFHVLNWCFNED